MEKAKLIKFFRNALLVFVVLIAMVWVKTYFYGKEQFLAGEKAFAAGDYKTAISDYETAIHMYTPLSGYVPSSAQRLWEIGQGFENAGEYDWSLIAYRSLRSSFYAVRSFYTPYKDWIERSEKQIDVVLALQGARSGPTPTKEALPPAHE
jgi:hypothetical protein